MIENQIINKAIDFILAHLEQDISIEEIADYCGYSRFYLGRLFRAETGESIYSFIKRVRVEQSAFRLKVEKSKSVTEIAESYGYSPSNYATLFKTHFKQTPAGFRKEIDERTLSHPFFAGVEYQLETYEECCKKITIEQIPDYFVLYERRKGSYNNLQQEWCSFCQRYEDFLTDDTIFIERTFDDPSITDSTQCMYEICMTVNKDDPRLIVQKTAAVGITSNLQTPPCPNTMLLPGGKFAVYHYKGYPQQIYAAYHNFFSRWLTESGNKIDFRTGFDIYRRIDTDTLYMELDICIPIV